MLLDLFYIGIAFLVLLIVYFQFIKNRKDEIEDLPWMKWRFAGTLPDNQGIVFVTRSGYYLEYYSSGYRERIVVTQFRNIPDIKILFEEGNIDAIYLNGKKDSEIKHMWAHDLLNHIVFIYRQCKANNTVSYQVGH